MVKLQKQYSQEDLSPDFRSFEAEQAKPAKLALFAIILLSCMLLSFFASYQGAAMALAIITEAPYKLIALIVSLISFVWLVITTVEGWVKGAFVSALFTVLIMLLVQIFNYSGLLRLTSDFFLSLTGNAIIQLAICCICFLFARFLIALAELVFLRSKMIKLLIVLAIFLVSTLTSLSVFESGSQRPSFFSGDKLESSSKTYYLSLKLIAVAGGFGLVSCLVTAASVVNQRKQVPWHYPNAIRELALTVGSWRGTSFRALDLSGLSFAGAKLANADLCAKKLYRTCFQGVVGLERARVDNQYLDLAYPKVQKLLTHGCSSDPDFCEFNLRGAYLQGADMRNFNLTDTNLTGAYLRDADLRNSTLIRAQLPKVDLQSANLQDINLTDAELTSADLSNVDLRNSVLVRTDLTRVDLSNANLTGICIQDWNFNSETKFTNVICDYVYRKLDEDGNPTDRFPSDRNFEPREFEALYQEVDNVVELIFKEGVNWRAFAFTLQKLQLEDEGLGLQLKGIEKRGDLWVIKVTHDENIPTAQVERQLKANYESLQQQLANKEQQINHLLGIASDQAQSLKELSKKPFGNHFTITGSTITNLAGGQIEYTEAAAQVRSLIASGGDRQQATSAAQDLLEQLQNQQIAASLQTQTELIRQILLSEAQKDPVFQQFLLQQGQQLIQDIPSSAIATAIQDAIAQLSR